MNHFAAFAQDAADNMSFPEQGKLHVPVLAVGGEASSGAMIETLMQLVADYVEGAVIPAQGTGLWRRNPK